MDRESIAVRLLIKLSVRLGGEWPDPDMLERLQRRRERFPVLHGLETAFTWIAILVFCVALYAAFFGPSFF